MGTKHGWSPIPVLRTMSGAEYQLWQRHDIGLCVTCGVEHTLEPYAMRTCCESGETAFGCELLLIAGRLVIT